MDQMLREMPVALFSGSRSSQYGRRLLFVFKLIIYIKG
jgi:hypothetical protein